MKVWDEAVVLQELIAARTAVAMAMGTSDQVRDEEEPGSSKVEFLLLLARKYDRKQYEFVYYPADSFVRIEELFDATTVVLEDGTMTSTRGGVFDDSEDDPMVWIGHPSSSDEEDSDSDGDVSSLNRSSFEPFYCGKVIFHTASGEPLMKIEGSPGWREALKQKYHQLDAKSRVRATDNVKQRQAARNHTAAKAVAAAAIGGVATTGGTSLAAGAMGYTSTGIVANSVAASIMSAEAVASGGGVAAGGFTATMQTIGAVGVMASPVGMTLAAGGAIVGLGGYYWIHRRNKKRRQEQEAAQEKQAKELLDSAVATSSSSSEDDQQSEESEQHKPNQYQPLCDEDTDHAADEEEAAASKDKDDDIVDFWMMVVAKRIITMEEDDSGPPEYCYDHAAWEEQADADKAFSEDVAAAKALFDPHGFLVKATVDPDDRDGWEMALKIHYTYLDEQGLIPTTREKHGEGATEDTPLLTTEH